LICSFNFLLFLAVCLNISTVIDIDIKMLTNSNQQTRSYKFSSHIAAFLSGFDHRDAWNLHTNIIWSKRSTDFKELSPCSVWYHLKSCLSWIRQQCFLTSSVVCLLSNGVDIQKNSENMQPNAPKFHFRYKSYNQSMLSHLW
jgi:hypothetical protein